MPVPADLRVRVDWEGRGDFAAAGLQRLHGLPVRRLRGWLEAGALLGLLRGGDRGRVVRARQPGRAVHPGSQLAR